jgi:hypothetical protein
MPDGDPASAFGKHHPSVDRHVEGDGFAKPFGQDGSLQFLRDP